MSDSNLRIYQAMIWVDETPQRVGKRVSVEARSLQEARERFEAEYGRGAVFDLRNEEDAARPR
jgi:hypothetical protein